MYNHRPVHVTDPIKKPCLAMGWRLFFIFTVFVVITVISGRQIIAQPRTVNYENWGGYISTLKINERWSGWNDVHYVPSVFAAWRTGVTYSFPSKFSVTGGYAYVVTSTTLSQQLIRNEHRPWGQVLYRFGISDKLTAQVRFRYDARYRKTLTQDLGLNNSFTLNHRWRFMGGLRFCIKRWGDYKKLHFNVMDEFLLQSFPNSGRGLSIDQNRLFLLLGFTYKHFTVQAGYHNRMQPGSVFGKWRFNHGPTLWLIHDIQSLKKQKQIPCYQDSQDNLF
jgi:hypothetical protein